MEKYVFGIDIGGTTVKYGMFGIDGSLLEKWAIATDTREEGAYILRDIADAVKAKQQEHSIDAKEIRGIGIGVPGPVQESRTVRKCVNLGWGVKNVAEELEQLTGIPVRAGNDANVAALGEMISGGGKGYKNLVMITLGTGVGGGIIVGGRILEGADGAAGEIGHINVRDDEAESCGCGNKGCLEQYASATGIVRMAERALETGACGSRLEDYGKLTAERIFSLAAQKDTLAVALVEDFCKILGRAMAQIASVVNPDIFVLGGGVSKAGNLLLDTVRNYFRHYAFHASRETPIELAVLGNDAGIYGSMGLFF